MTRSSNGPDSLAKFKRQTAEYVKRLKKTGKPVVLTVNGTGCIVVQDVDAYRRLVQAAAMTENGAATSAILAGLDDVEAGRTKAARPALKALAKKHGISTSAK